MKTFVINLDSATDRWKHYENTDYHRWRATPYQEVTQEQRDRMCSIWNTPPKTHSCKTACFFSHYSLWEHIAKHKLNDVLILEDDAKVINTAVLKKNSFSRDGITYLGGALHSPKMTDKFIKVELEKGIHLIDFTKYRVLMTMSYYIPEHEIAQKLIKMVDSKKRTRAIDVMLGDIKNNNELNAYISYPASVIERPNESQIQSSSRTKYANELYCFGLPCLTE